MELLFSQYFNELFAVISISLITIITPGPDFVIVTRNSLSHSRRSGIFTALGVSSAVWVHIFYTLAGIGLILSRSIILFSIVKLFGAAYLIFLGVSCIKNHSSLEDGDFLVKKTGVSDFQSFKMGFMNNTLNPKATLFFLSLFTQLVSPATPLVIQVLYGAIVSLSCLFWFSLVAVFLNRADIKKGFLKIQKYVEKFMGTILVFFGIKVALSTAG